jgi:DNA-binding transcriptional LysR family regulator
MDKFRALEYFVATAEEGSLSGAARRLEVTVPAALKVIAALERSLGATLFDRSPQGLALTADGARYLESCRPLLEQLADADESVSSSANRPRGTVVLGTHSFTQNTIFLPALPQFHARYPEIALDIRTVNRLTDPDAASVDVFALFGWHEAPDMIHKRIAQTSYHVIASPAYWKAHGKPRHPKDLATHQCLIFRNPEGTLLDFWEFDRGSEQYRSRSRGGSPAPTRSSSSGACIAGEGVGEPRTANAGAPQPRRARAGARGLDPSPPAAGDLFFRRSIVAPRASVSSSTSRPISFRRLEAEREQGQPPSGSRPDWYHRQYGRASRAARERR